MCVCVCVFQCVCVRVCVCVCVRVCVCVCVQVRLKHRDTGAYLYSHEMRFGQPIAGQQEVCSVERKDRNSEWQAAEGVYFPVHKPAKGEAAAHEEL